MNPEVKEALVAAALRYREANNGILSNAAVTVIADQFDISKRTVRRWVRDALGDEAPPSTSEPREAFVLSADHLARIRALRSIKKAHAEFAREADGFVSYPTFARAFNRLPGSIRAGVLRGADAMADKHVYLSTAGPHVNHTWHLDHQQASLWVAVGGGQVTKPWVSSVRDSATGAVLASVAYLGRPNEDSICDVLATAAHGHRYGWNGQQVTLGGLPVQLVLDNAAEHFSASTIRGSVLLGVVIAPTMAYEKRANGSAENMNRQITGMVMSLPGYSKAENATSAAPMSVDLPGDVDLDHLVSMEAFQARLDDLVDELNTKPVRRLGGRSRVQAWAEDPTVRRAVDPETVRLMMRREARDRVVHAEGIRFRGKDYIAPELNYYRGKGETVSVAYLTREERFIEVFDASGNWVCRAYDRNLLTEGQRFQILNARRKSRQFLVEIDARAVEDRRHAAATEEFAEYDEESTTGLDWQEALDENVVRLPGLSAPVDTTAAKTFTPRKQRQIAPPVGAKAERAAAKAEMDAAARNEERRRLRMERERNEGDMA